MIGPEEKTFSQTGQRALFCHPQSVSVFTLRSKFNRTGTKKRPTLL